MFVVGDIVYLISGGPAMTIQQHQRDGEWISHECCWIDEDGHVQKEWFDSRTITKELGEES